MVRVKNRYIIAQLMWNSGSKEKFDELLSRDIQSVLRDKIVELFGDVGVGEFGNSTLVKYFESQYSKILVIRTTRESQQNAHLALSCITKIKEIDVTLRSISVHSCPRTCAESLKTLLGVYFEKTELKAVADKAAAERAVLVGIDAVEF